MNARGAAGPVGPREAAYRAVLDVLHGRGFAGAELRELRSAGRVSGRDAGLAMEIALGAVRHLFTIEEVLSRAAHYDRRRVSAELRAILASGAYQVIWMDRVPAFAAVDEAVKLARRHVNARAGGMVNAVLRGLSRALVERRTRWRRLDAAQVRTGWQEACAFGQKVVPPPDDDDGLLAHLAAVTGENLERFATLVGRFGLEAAEGVAWASQAVPAIVVQRNTLRGGVEEFRTAVAAGLAELDASHVADYRADAAFLPAATPVGRLPPVRNGLAYVQDTTAHAAALAVAPQAGERVLDLCAAPGGKSVALALAMQDLGEVVACDAAPERLALVGDNVRRLGLTCVRLCEPPGLDPDDRRLGVFDAALVDVPCSNTGVIARRPEARLGLTSAKVRSLVRTQIDLLHVAARHVRPGGRAVYSTCSIEPEENEGVVATFLSEQPAWRCEFQRTTLPVWGPRSGDWRDGGFVGRLVRNSE